MRIARLRAPPLAGGPMLRRGLKSHSGSSPWAAGRTKPSQRMRLRVHQRSLAVLLVLNPFPVRLNRDSSPASERNAGQFGRPVTRAAGRLQVGTTVGFGGLQARHVAPNFHAFAALRRVVSESHQGATPAPNASGTPCEPKRNVRGTTPNTFST
jgi:hypothetical protein